MTRMFAALRWPLGAVVLAVLALVPLSVARAADAPLELAGLRLGQIVDDVADKLVGTGVDRVIHRPYIGVMPMAAVPGYRSGYVDFGLCAKPGRIVRIKMNYADDSLAFFHEGHGGAQKALWRAQPMARQRVRHPAHLEMGLADPGRAAGQPDSHALRRRGRGPSPTATPSVSPQPTWCARRSSATRRKAGMTGRRAAGKKAEPDVSSLGPDWFLPR